MHEAFWNACSFILSNYFSSPTPPPPPLPPASSRPLSPLYLLTTNISLAAVLQRMCTLELQLPAAALLTASGMK